MDEVIFADAGAVGVFWGKSDAAGVPNLLVQHLLDTAAVGELIWRRFLAPAVRRSWDAATDGAGCTLFTALCGLHDVGKATPAFQSKVPALAVAVQGAGLTWRRLKPEEQAWHHTIAGAYLLRDALPEQGWPDESVRWLWPFVAGHHGKVPSAGRLRPPGLGSCQGIGPGWRQAQQELVRLMGVALGLDWVALGAVRPPSRAAQLALLGSLVMADWIASNERFFPGVVEPKVVSLVSARQRAAHGWAELGLRGGWAGGALSRFEDPVMARFDVPARPGQSLIVDAAERIPAPGLLIVEAPMGEGKTEAALAAAEVLARRFGADGVFVGMPTQATSDPMFGRVRRWASRVDGSVPLALLHGKARFNREWRDLLEARTVQVAGVDEYGCNDPYGTSPEPDHVIRSGDHSPMEWLLGAKRGLLNPIVVGTVDHLLYAATRTRHVMLRHAGLAGKVVILDEVHAYDVYMSQFLQEALRWLAEAGVPVIVLSATLPPATRDDLARSYLQGATSVRDIAVELSAPEGYPSCTWVTAVSGNSMQGVASAESWRPSVAMGVTIMEEPVDGSPAPLVDLLGERLIDGGCALVVRNTVGRAQQAYRALRAAMGEDVVLLHSRLTVGERADRTERILDLLGPATPGRERPHRLIVVATQLAEQSFDVDVDLLVTDLAPIDLLLQRAGRLHRHDRPPGTRPERVRVPQIVVTGMRGGRKGPPTFPFGSRKVYGRHLLLRAGALVLEGADRAAGWSVPEEVPELVRRGYAVDVDVPSAWQDDAAAAAAEHLAEESRRQTSARQFILAGPDDLGGATLAGLHERPLGDPVGLDDEDVVAAVVRDGDPSVEIVLVRRDAGGYRTLDGRPLGPTGEAISDGHLLEQVLRDCLRLPPSLTDAALASLAPLPGWAGDPWLSRTRALVLDLGDSAELGGQRLTYDPELGLVNHAIPT